MLDKFNSVLMSVFSFVFSFWTMIPLVVVLIIWMGVTSDENAAKEKEARRAATELCYTQGMVLVETDAGPRCADPRGLLKLK